MKKVEETKGEEKQVLISFNNEQVHAVKLLIQLAHLSQSKGILSIDDAFVIKKTLDVLKEIIPNEKGS